MLKFKFFVFFFGVIRLGIKKVFDAVRRIIIFFLLFLIKVYQYFFSPIISPCCRFYPSCSSYGIEAILTHGIIKGLFLLALRVVKCNRWSHGGYDPVSSKGVKKPCCYARSQNQERENN